MKEKFNYSYCAAFFFACLGIFLVIILFSYDAHDSSFFYKSFNYSSWNNWAGLWGAYSASLIFFLFGLAGYLLIPFSFIIAYVFARSVVINHILKTMPDRVIGFMVFICSSAMLLHHYDNEHADILCNGGILGILCNKFLLLFFDQTLAFIFLYMMMLVGIVLLSQLSYMWLGIKSWDLLRTLLNNDAWYSRTMFYAMIRSMPRRFINEYTRIIGLVVGYKSPEHAQTIAFEELVAQSWYQEYLNDASLWDSLVEKKEKQQEDSMAQTHYATSINEDAMQESDEVQAFPEPIIPYQLPNPRELFKGIKPPDIPLANQKNIQQRARALEEKLERFGIQGSVVSIHVGPVITLFEYEPHIDSKISKIIALEDDLALALEALSIRIIAPIPGKSVVGFEVAYQQRRTILLAHALCSKEFEEFKGQLPLVMGENSNGEIAIIDLARATHLLVAGSTGSGKSVALNAMIMSLLCKHTPSTLKFILIDPKRLEFSLYADIPHLLFPIVTEARKAIIALQWVIKIMYERYELMETCSVRNIMEYNEYCVHNKIHEPLPFLVIIIDELADLMMSAGREIEDLITRITQMARAAGIHMIVATQRPSVDVITGLIKVNFPSRIAFKVTSKIDSRVILDCMGADKLLGKGDMLYLDISAQLHRLHGAYVAAEHIEHVVAFSKEQQKPRYIDTSHDTAQPAVEDEDVLLHEVIEFLKSVDEVSISLVQRKFRIGYNRAARIIELLEEQGFIVRDVNGKTRKVVRS